MGSRQAPKHARRMRNFPRPDCKRDDFKIMSYSLESVCSVNWRMKASAPFGTRRKTDPEDSETRVKGKRTGGNSSSIPQRRCRTLCISADEFASELGRSFILQMCRCTCHVVCRPTEYTVIQIPVLKGEVAIGELQDDLVDRDCKHCRPAHVALLHAT